MSPVATRTLFDVPANEAALAAATARMAEHRRIGEELERQALELHSAGEDAAAVCAAAVAARFAHGSHSGRFASPALERMLLDVGRRQVGGGPGRNSGGAEVGHVLHVLTETYLVGGHTRLARRWIDLDRGRRHSVFVTGVMNDVTEWLVASAVASGGTVMMCGSSEPATERARALRAAAAAADLVVLHVHPFDPVPVLAFAEPEGRPPVVLMNHADHTFWLGVGVADAVADFRPSGSAVTAQRRGVTPERCLRLPLPLPAHVPVADPRAARARLRLDADRPLLATVASAYKFGAVLEPAFADLASGVLRAVPDALLIAVGPEHDERWAAASAEVGGRLLAVGYNPDAATLLEAADVYVDSWPCSSATAVLEAGLQGLPIATLRPDAAAQGLLTPDMTSLDGTLVACADPDELAASIAGLVADPERRHQLGTVTRERIADEHAGAGWIAALEALIEAAHALGPVGPPADRPPVGPETWEATLDALHAAAGMGITSQEALVQETASRRVPPGAVGQARVVAAPPADPAGIGPVVQAFRDLQAMGRAGQCIVALTPDALEGAIPLLEAALAEGDDVDIDVMAMERPEELPASGDVCVAQLGARMAGAAGAVGAVVRVVTPANAPGG